MLKQINDLISVIVPMYNSEKTIKKCVRSIQDSTYGNIEIILVDDGSKDNTVELCKEMQNYDSRIKLYTKDNSGAGETRSFGLQKATGKYIAFVDSDDWIEIDMYEKLYERVVEENLDVCFCGYYSWNVIGNRNEEPMRFAKSIYAGKEILEEVIHNTVWFPTSSMNKSSLAGVWIGLYSAEIIINSGIKFLNEREIYSEDSLFNLEFLNNSNRVGFIRDCYYNHMYAEGTLTTTIDSRYEKMNEWYFYICEYSKNNGIYQYVVPYLNTQYLREFRARINYMIETEKNKKTLANKYNLINKQFVHISGISIFKLQGCNSVEKIKFKIMVCIKRVYIMLKKYLVV